MKGKNLIKGQWTDVTTGQFIESRNPANWDEVLGKVPRSNGQDVHQAVSAAREAFPAWRRLSRIKRAEYLDAFVQLVKRDHEDLSRLMAKEVGKSINEARADVTEGIHMIQHEFGLGRMPFGDVMASEIDEKDSFIRRKPKGVVAAITPWNFPFAVPLWLIGPSLLEGNTVVFKPSEESPLVGQRIVEYFQQAGLPPGVLNLVHGTGEETGKPLVRHPDVDVVVFTGSYEVGSEIKEVCAKDYKKMAVCEMGGKNGVIIFEDADLRIAVNASILSAFKTSGQRCTSASRLIVHEQIIDAFEQEFIKLTRRLNIGDPLSEKTFMGPLINEAGRIKVESYNDLAVKEGGKVLLEGGRPKGKIYEKGFFVYPFVYRMEHNFQNRVLREEVFGPHVSIIPFRTVEDAIRIYNDTPYGLSLAVITEDYRKARIIREECEYGLGYVNLPTIGAEVHLPFGGVKKSGTGIPSASGLVDAVTHKTAWTINHAREIKMAQGLKAEIE
ncbi:MAG: aldehyde dehydrogenase family protein [Nitrospira sp.]|nr:aldehyde dehydrogenase family protein [Nitrospira sp.]